MLALNIYFIKEQLERLLQNRPNMHVSFIHDVDIGRT